jgi:dynein heavy chain
MVIFQNYGLDLEAVQKIYEKSKHSPPLVRNAPPVAGNIMWSRQLLRRIEEPMKRFSQNKSIMTTKESKRIVKTYNRVARALIEFEMLWHQGWVKSIENAKAGLQATLIVRHPDSGKLLVNFDKEIMQLMRETKYLQRMGVEVPESAKMVLLQETKFKLYYNELGYVLREHARVMAEIHPVATLLLAPHIEDLEKKISPGLYILTWTSMNIDGYLSRVHAGLASLEELINKLNDVLENRVDANLKVVSRTLLIDLPSDRSFSFEDFVATQAKFITEASKDLIVRNKEVERATSELVTLVREHPRENTEVPITETAISTFTKHFEKLMYQAVLAATKNSFNKMKKRLGSRSSGGFLFVERPFFDVDVELAIPDVVMKPSLEEIQTAINETAKKVLPY